MPYFLIKRRQQFQIDLIDIREHSIKNNSYTFLFTCIDGFTKKAWVVPILTKSADNVLEAYKSIMHEIIVPPDTLISDQGTEIKNKKFMKYINEVGTKQWYPINEVHASIIERFNQTFQSLLYKYITSTEGKKHAGKFFNVIANLVNTYNNSYHTTIKMTPNEADLPENHSLVYEAHNEHFTKILKKKTKKILYKVGDTVRIKVVKGKFSRSYDQPFLNEIFIIHAIKKKMPIVTFVLKDLKDEILDGTFYSNELSKVSGSAVTDKNKKYLVEHVLDTRIVKNKKGRRTKESLVKFKGWADKHNIWTQYVN